MFGGGGGGGAKEAWMGNGQKKMPGTLILRQGDWSGLSVEDRDRTQTEQKIETGQEQKHRKSTKK